MHADVVGVTVATLGVIGDDNSGGDVGNGRAHEFGHLEEVAPREGAGMGECCRADHARIAVCRTVTVRDRAEIVVGHAQDRHGAGQLAPAVLGQGVADSAFEVGELCWDDLALLAERAREDVDVITAHHVVQDRDTGRERLVIGMSVDEEQAAHWWTAMSANSTTPPMTSLAERLRTSLPAM